MEVSNRPNIPKGSHPIETGRYLIPTNAIIQMHNTVSKWITNRSPGGMIYGRPRIGKTRAINYLTHDLKIELGEALPIFNVRCRKYVSINESSFFTDLLSDIGHLVADSGKANVKRERLIRYFIEKAETSVHKRIILFLDDAQRLRETHYDWLMDIYNELDAAGIYLTVILVGQEELIYQRSAFIHSKKAQIIGRFMVHEHKFTGIRDLSEVTMCLSGYDMLSEYPPGSNCSFTEFFMPKAFHLGYRLEHSAKDLFNVIIELKQEAGIKKQKDIPMQYLTLTVEYALRNFGIDGENLDFIHEIQWKEAVINSGYISAELYQDVVI